jgi:hypothetical protein
MAAPLGSVMVPLSEALVSCPKLKAVAANRKTPRKASIRQFTTRESLLVMALMSPY